MAEATKVQGFRGHSADDAHVICVVCPNEGCGFRQGVTAPGLFRCRCNTLIDVAAHEGWKPKAQAPALPVLPTPPGVTP